MIAFLFNKNLEKHIKSQKCFTIFDATLFFLKEYPGDKSGDTESLSVFYREEYIGVANIINYIDSEKKEDATQNLETYISSPK